MPITFDRHICRNLDETISREWFLTNGLGGYAAGTVAGSLTRMQQGVLVASQEVSATPQLLLAKIDEEVFFDQRTYYLGTNEYRDGTLNPAGFVHLESFHLEEGFPIFTYHLGGIDGIMLEKRIWMPQGQNTTYIQYRVLRTSLSSRGSADSIGRMREGRVGYPAAFRSYNYAANYPANSSLTLTLLPLVAYRPYNQPQYARPDWHFQVKTLCREDEEMPALPRGVAGCTISAQENAPPYHLLAVGNPDSSVQFLPTGVWYWRFLRRHDRAAGLPDTDDLYLPGVIRAQLWSDKDITLTLIISTEELAAQLLQPRQIAHSYEQALDYQRSLTSTQRYFGEGGSAVHTLPVLPLADPGDSRIKSDEFLQLLHQAGNRLLVQRSFLTQDRPDGPAFFFRAVEHGPAIIPGYYQLEENLRETLIALPGLTLATRRHSEGQRILRYLSRHFHQGLLPGRLPTTSHPVLDDADYNNADVSLWYFYALDKYLRETRDYDLLDELYPHLVDSLAWYTRGTLHGIQIDPGDGLLCANAPGLALTWMNASVHGSPITPRSGKPVELNALWYNALSLLHEWSQLLFQRGRINHTTSQYVEQRELCERSFNARFWYQDGGYLYDLIDSPEGNDSSLRPNQLLAISLSHSVLQAKRRIAVLDIINQQLLTRYGLRTLSPHDPHYRGNLPEHHEEQQQALHQGSAWPWLIGPYVDTLLKVGDQLSAGSPENPHRPAHPDLYKEYVWRRGLAILEPFRQHMQQDMLGTISSVYAGEPPHNSGPQLASAISIGEILRTYNVLANLGVQHLDRVISA